MRWSVTKSNCTDAVVWIVRTPAHSWEYTPFETEKQACAYALGLNTQAEREDAERGELEEAQNYEPDGQMPTIDGQKPTPPESASTLVEQVEKALGPRLYQIDKNVPLPKDSE